MSGRRAARTLSAAEVEAVVARSRWAVLSTVEGDRPYAVPIVFGWDGEAFYVINGPGRKIRNIEANPRVCLTIAEVEEGGRRWRSVVAEGRAEMVGLSGMLHAAAVVRRQLGDYQPTVRDAAALARAKIIRLVPEAMTGRAVEEDATGAGIDER